MVEVQDPEAENRAAFAYNAPDFKFYFSSTKLLLNFFKHLQNSFKYTLSRDRWSERRIPKMSQTLMSLRMASVSL